MEKYEKMIWGLVALLVVVGGITAANKGGENAYHLGCLHGAINACTYSNRGCEPSLEVVNAALDMCIQFLK